MRLAGSFRDLGRTETDCPVWAYAVKRNLVLPTVQPWPQDSDGIVEDEYFKSLLRSVPIGIIYTDLDGNCGYVNDRWTQITGRNAEQSMGRGWFDAVHPDDRQAFIDAWFRSTAQRIDTVFECRLLGPNGTSRWTYLEAIPDVDDRDGQVIGYVGTLVDITEKKQVEGQLRESEARYRALIQSCPDGLALVDGYGTLMMVNPRTAHMHGYSSPQEMLAQKSTIFDFITGDQHEEVWRARAAAIDNGVLRAAEYGALHRDGSRFAVEISTAPVSLPDGSLIGFIGIERDITDRKRSEQERKRLEDRVKTVQKLESLGILAGGVAHDFNNLLTVVVGNTNLASSFLPPISPERKYLADVESAAQRAAALSNEMLSYLGKGKMYAKRVCIADVVGTMKCLLEATVSKKVSLRFDLETTEGTVLVDPAQLRQVVMNLVSNASDAIGDHNGDIVIASGIMHCDRGYLDNTYPNEFTSEGSYGFLQVSDTGCGMDKSTLAKAFDPFFTTKADGRGLALSTLLGIVRAHHGTIAIQTAPHRGSCFRILFPLAAPTMPESHPLPSSLPPPLVRPTILLVDDEESVRIAGKGLLLCAGFSVLVAESGRGALDLFKRHRDRIACVVLDVHMPFMDGLTTMTALRQIRSDIPVILSLDDIGGSEAQDLACLADASVMMKPYGFEQLVDKLRTTLSRERA